MGDIRLFSKKIKIDNEELWLTIDKVFHVSIDRDYYEYHCKLYKEADSFWMPRKKEVCFYRTYWLEYFEYCGDIDKVIEELIDVYRKNKKEQKYISEKESNFKSKYEV